MSARVGQMSAVCVTFARLVCRNGSSPASPRSVLAIDVGRECDIKLAVEAAVWAE
jgi:hypothetical protein